MNRLLMDRILPEFFFWKMYYFRNWHYYFVLASLVALTAACLNGRKEIVLWLLKIGASPETTNMKSFSPLLCAVEAGKWELVDLLLSLGSSIEQTDKHGRTPLMIAAYKGHIGVLEMLLSRGKTVINFEYLSKKLYHLSSAQISLSQWKASSSRRVINALIYWLSSVIQSKWRGYLHFFNAHYDVYPTLLQKYLIAILFFGKERVGAFFFFFLFLACLLSSLCL